MKKSINDYQKISAERNKVTVQDYANRQNRMGVTFASFHDAIAQDVKNNPAPYQLYNQAISTGTAQTTEIYNKAKEYTHPEHEDSRRKFQNQYNMDFATMKNDHINKAAKAIGAKVAEYSDGAYQNRIIGGYRPKDSYQQAITDKFVAHMRAKWHAVGYAGDEQEITDFWNEHGGEPAKNTTHFSAGYQNQ